MSVTTSIGIVCSAGSFGRSTRRSRLAHPPQNFSAGPLTQAQVAHAPGRPLPQPPQNFRQGSLW